MSVKTAKERFNPIGIVFVLLVMGIALTLDKCLNKKNVEHEKQPERTEIQG